MMALRNGYRALLQARRAARGQKMLRRAFEHVLVMAVVEGAALNRSPYYDGYVEALQLLNARAAMRTRAEAPGYAD